MEEYDLIVIGSGAGMNVASNAIQLGMRVAVVEHGLMGGTCLNTGCIPSKILLYPADVIRELDEAKVIGVEGTITKVDLPLMMRRMRTFVEEDRGQMEFSVDAVEDLRWYRETGEFVGDHQLKVGKDTITAPKIVIASGARALVPPIEGLRETGYIDHVSVLQLDALPESLIIIGGGYIACEYGHFFSALGTTVTLLEMMPRLLLGEDPEISGVVERRFSKYAEIHTNHEVVKVAKKGDQKVVTTLNREDNKTHDFTANEIMLAAGVRSNSDLLKPEKTGVETDEHGWIKVNKYLETTKPDVWALGDALGKHMFRHTANYEAQVVWMNAFTDHKHPVDYHAVPHAVFGYPQVGGVGLTEEQAKAAGYEILVGRAEYMDVTKGYAIGEEDGLVKVVVEQDTGRILGCHIVGSHGAILVQQIVYLMNAGEQDYIPLADSQVIHPALSEVVINAFGNMAPPDHVHEHHG
jgi:dihydrolipoamide dehydrogenase